MPEEMDKIYSILSSVFRPGEVMEQDEEPEEPNDLDAEIDDAPEGGDSEPGDDLGDELGGDDLGDDFGGGDDLGGDLGGDFGGGGPDDDDEESDEEVPEEEPEKEPIGPQPDETNLTDEQKIDKLFSDTGDIDFDYGAGTEPNLRLTQFKFVNAGVDPNMYMDEEEKVTGVPSVVIEDRLSPEQKEVYFQANQKLREKYPKVAEREKNILIFNSGVRFVHYDLDNNEQPIEDPVVLNKAYKRIDEYLTKRYGVHWQDKREAVELLKNIKVNFGDEEKIQPNLISSDNFTPANEIDLAKIPFNKIAVETPAYLGEFIRDNLENPEFSKSSIFNSMSSTYLTGKGKHESPYAIIKGQTEEDDMTSEVDAEEPDFGDELDAEEPDLGDEEEGVDEVEI